MYWVYVLYSEEHDRFYIGSSASPDVRLNAHNSGKVRSTKAYKPWKRVWLEEYESRSIAEKRERYLKSGWGRKWLMKNL
jgi:putative endonuclease